MQLSHRQISKKHARIEWNGDAWCVTDLASRNGTTVNRWKLSPDDPVILHDGDELALGPCRFEIRLGTRQTRRRAEHGSGTFATRESIFLRLRDDRRDVQELGWEEFRRRYAPVIIGFSRNAGLPAQDAEDVLQDVMLGFYRLVPEFEYDPTRGRFRGYLKRATLNAIRKRARKRRPETGADERLPEQESEDTDSQWAQAWAEQLYSRAMEEARRRFDARTVEAYELYARRSVPAETVAQRLKMSVNSVHQAKRRVLNVVRAVVEQLKADEG